MSFQLLAIKVLKGCSPKIRKCLYEGTLYCLSSLYKADSRCNENLLKEDISIEKKSVYDNLYRVKKTNGEYLGVKVSAIVGMNGDGKSSFIELIIRILNNFAYNFGFLSDQETLCYVNGLKANLYYEVNGNIFCISCNDEVIKWYKNGEEIDGFQGISDDEKKKKLKRHVDCLFYTMVINYSLYAYNSELLKDECSNDRSWIDGLFHKNDGYQTPVVINPMRISGNIDVNREEYLSRQRLLSLFVTAKPEEGGRNISNDEIAEGFAFSIQEESKLISKTINDYFVQVRPTDCLWGDMKPYVYPNEKIPEGLMEVFSNFWIGFLKDYHNNKNLFEIAFRANEKWEKSLRTDLARYFNLFRQCGLNHYKNNKRFSFKWIQQFSKTNGNSKINYMQFYRVLMIIAVWRQLSIREDLPQLKGQNLNEVLNKQNEPRYACMLYVLYKIISIMDTYKGICNPWYLRDQSYMVFERPWPNENIEGSIASDIDKILSIHDYRTLKLWQTINYLKRYTDDMYGAKMCEIFGIKDKYDYFISFNDLSEEFTNFPVNKLLPFLPAPIFVGDIVLKRGNDFYTVNTLSSGMIQRLNSVGSFIYHIRNLDNEQKDDLLIDYSNLTVIFEEVELYFHPEYQKSYLQFLLKQIERSQLVKIKNLHIVFVTHSPFVLSDVLSNNILCLKDGKQISSFGFNSFGANIHDLLRQPFFMKYGTIGDYAQSVINKIIAVLRYYDENNINETNNNNKIPTMDNSTQEDLKNQYDYKYLFELISMLDEPIVKHSLMKEYNRIFSTDYYNSQRIQYLEEELKRLKKQK